MMWCEKSIECSGGADVLVADGDLGGIEITQPDWDLATRALELPEQPTLPDEEQQEPDVSVVCARDPDEDEDDDADYFADDDDEEDLDEEDEFDDEFEEEEDEEEDEADDDDF